MKAGAARSVPYYSIDFVENMSNTMNLNPNVAELKLIRKIAESDRDGPVLMLNQNRYAPAAGYPDGQLYRDYMKALHGLLPKVGGKILWQIPVYGQPVGEQALHEILAAWYPTHKAFIALREQVGAEESFRLRALAVEYAVIHRCPAGVIPMATQDD